MSHNVQALSLYQYQIPLQPNLPVGTQQIDSRQGLVLRAELENDQSISVEISPLSGDDHQGEPITSFSQELLQQTSEELQHQLGKLQEINTDTLDVLAQNSPISSIAFGLSLLSAKLQNKLQAHNSKSFMPNKVALIYRQQQESEQQLSQRIVELGQGLTPPWFKVKVGQAPLESDIKLIHQILTVYPQARLRLDANQSLSLDHATSLLACLPKQAIEYIEEPCDNLTDNLSLFNQLGYPWALDESLHSEIQSEDQYSDAWFQRCSGLTALVIKPTLFGSLEKLQQLVDSAEHHGVRVVISSALEASLGIADLKQLSLTLNPDERPGLDTLAPFESDLLVSSGKARCLGYDELMFIGRWTTQ